MNDAQQPTLITKRYDDIRKSQADTREYRGFELSNGLKLLLVSDPTTQKAAASFNVNIGHLMDPAELPGLAHFCEHMLKIPKESASFNFIKGEGVWRTFTGADSTNYSFHLALDMFPEALKRFTQLFISPLFPENAVEREVNAVHSEHTNNLQSDFWRIDQLNRTLAKPGHDYKFGTGNRETLMEIPKANGVSLRDELLKFHETYYSSNIMACTILGSGSLDELETLAMSLNLGDIANKNVKPKSWEDDHVYGPEQLGHRIDVVTIADVRQLSLSFAVDDMTSFYKCHPERYIAHLLGHKGKGSLFSELKRLGWATFLLPSYNTVARGIGRFDIGFKLSEEGFKHIEEIVELTFQKIGNIRAVGSQKWIQDELNGVGEINFRFNNTGNPVDYVNSLSDALQAYPFEDVLMHSYLSEEFDPELVEKLLGQLIPENMNCFVLSKTVAELENLSKEHYYGTEYRKTKLDAELMEKYKKALVTSHEAFFMPKRNEYIASQFDLRPRDENKVTTPRIVRDDTQTRVWYRQDGELKIPKAGVLISISFPKVAAATLSILFSPISMCFTDSVVEEVYNANLAGLNRCIHNLENGLELKFDGYNEKLGLFAVNYVRQLVNFQADQTRFRIALDDYARALKDLDHEEPHVQSQKLANLLLNNKQSTTAQLLTMTENVTFEKLNKFIGDLWKALHVEIFVHGNLSEGEALSLTDEILAVFHEKNEFVRPLLSNELELNRALKLNEGDSRVYEVKQNSHANSAVCFILQTGVAEPRTAVLLDMFVQMAKESANSILHTKDLLSDVSIGVKRSNGALSLEMIVHRSYAPKYAEERIEAFLKSFRETIAGMSKEEYQKNVHTLKTRLLAKKNNHWEEIKTKQYFFNKNEIFAAEVEKLSKEDLLQFYDEKIAAGSPKRQKLSVRVVSTLENVDNTTTVSSSDSDNGGVFIEDIACFKASLSEYEHPKPAFEIMSISKESE